MTGPILPLHPCPHGCGARLGISSRTTDGERGRCGQCRGVSEYRGGTLHAITWEDVLWAFMEATNRNIDSITESIQQAVRDGVTLKAPTRPRRARPQGTP